MACTIAHVLLLCWCIYSSSSNRGRVGVLKGLERNGTKRSVLIMGIIYSFLHLLKDKLNP